ncbi:cell division protein FtsA [Candidatus Dojkabacteria bacterium]|uniref:Cell division protein FtsA n=1 Tax=Candidatus Dojkabacteria bacterium TaxID=2099670 RepID=A0A955LAC2_9BACT|nr:cell division protein FtsA [Candidatus Dojkabacteria bacterium]
MSNIITAIDIGSHKVSAVVTVVDESGKAKVIGESSHPSYGIKKGEITGIEEAINSIASALNGAERMAGLTVSSAYVSINGKNIISNNNKGVVAISDSEILEEDVIRSLEQARTVAIPQAREIIHLIPREFIVDQQTGIKNPVGMTGTRLEVDAHIISAPSTAIHNIERCVQSIGLKIDDIVFSGWASSHSVLTPTEKELGVLLLDVGGGTTTITTFVEDAVAYSSCIPFGGSNVTRDLAAGLRLFSLDDAEKVKVNANELFRKAAMNKKKENTDVIEIEELGIEGAKTMSKKLFLEIMTDRIEEIFKLVVENIEQAGNDAKLPAGVVITGGSASLPEITNIASKVFGVPARVGSPRGLEGLTDSISSPAYATLQGLVQHGLQDDHVSSSGSRFQKSGGIKSGAGMADKVIGFLKNLLP